MAYLRHLAALALLCGAVSASPTGVPLDAAVKASYLYKFAPFIRWPATAFSGPTEPLTICLGTPDPFGPLLDDAVRGQRVNGHPIAIRRLEAGQSEGSCQILFATGEGADEMLRAVAHAPVLTVTDRSRGDKGGMIQFVTTGGRIRFMVDLAAAQQNGIAISSKLLGLAVSVTR